MPQVPVHPRGRQDPVRVSPDRSGEQAERLAQAVRDKRDPVKIKLQKIAESEAVKDAVRLKPLEHFRN
jgi:hypothetical protein